MGLIDLFIISFIANLILFVTVVLLIIAIKAVSKEWFGIGWKLFWNKSLVLVQRVYNSGTVKFSVEQLEAKLPFDPKSKRGSDVILSKQTFQRLDYGTDKTLEEKERLISINPEKLRLRSGNPVIVLRQDAPENIDLLNLTKPELDSSIVNDQVKQAYEDGYEDGVGNRSKIEKLITFALILTGLVLLLSIVNTGLLYDIGQKADSLVKAFSGFGTDLTGIKEQVAGMVKDAEHVIG
jgi:hypothetical protein